MHEELPDGSEIFVLRAVCHDDTFYVSEGFDGEPGEEIERSGAMIREHTEDTVFRVLSRGCERCDALGIDCGESYPETASGGAWGGWLRKGATAGWRPRQVLLETKHTKRVVSTGATAHQMEVHVPFPRGHESTPGHPEESTRWCPDTPRNPSQTDSVPLVTKLPTWNKTMKTMVLDFAGRVKKASARNFQLCHKGEESKGKGANVILQYGKVKKEVYTLDYQYPLSALQALGIALTTSKWK